jgi:hypothetical protein
MLALAAVVVAAAAALYLLSLSHIEAVLAADDSAEHAPASASAVVVLGYRLEWPAGTPVRL